MRKMRLDLDALAVDSFSVSGHAGNGGTVKGNEDTYTCTCPNWYTCLANCVITRYGPGDTCYESGDGC